MGRRLRATVYLTGEDGSTKCLLAGSLPTDAEAALIPNEKAWEEVEPAGPIPTNPGEPGETAPEPPRRGPGSSKSAWAAYAVGLSYGFTPAQVDQMDRDAIVALIDARRRED